jgi:sporulation protein YlmC with PRC-barrel domain
MRLKELRGLPVIDPTAARKIGTVTDYQIDSAGGRIAALDIASVDGGAGERILAQRVRRVGSSAVVLTARGGSLPAAPVETNERWLDTSTLVGLEVMGDDGNRIGRVVDATFDQDTLAIGEYVLAANFFERLFGRRGRVQPSTVHACSRELMIVNTGHVKEQPEPPAEDTAPIDVRMQLKDADRLPVPTYSTVEDGHPVGARQG